MSNLRDGTVMAYEELRISIKTRDLTSGCVYCGKELNGLFTIDHVIPICFGGLSTSSNLVLSCKECNTVKGSELHPMYLLKALKYLESIGESINWINDILIMREAYKKVEITCTPCGRNFLRKHFNQKYCSSACRQAAYRVAHGYTH